jgi:hypothetical protein
VSWSSISSATIVSGSTIVSISLNSMRHPPFLAPSTVFQRGPLRVRFRNEAGERDGRSDREASMTA